MVDAFEQTGGNIVAAMSVPESQISSHGVIDPKGRNGRLVEMMGMVENQTPKMRHPTSPSLADTFLIPALWPTLPR